MVLALAIQCPVSAGEDPPYAVWFEDENGEVLRFIGTNGFGNRGLEPGDWVHFALELHRWETPAWAEVETVWDVVVFAGGLAIRGSGIVFDGHIADSERPLTIGGVDEIGRTIDPWADDHFGMPPSSLPGTIDNVRISVGALPRIDGAVDGTYHELVPDENTIALWRFNPDVRFVDASGNAHHLTQYIPGRGLAVAPHSSMTTTWAALKRP